MINYKIYTDGASSKGSGACGFILFADDVLVRAESFYFEDVTNQEMELAGIAAGCAYVFSIMKKYYDADNNCILEDKCEILSDSAYCVNCWIEDWWKVWIKNGWLNSKKQPVANRELWEMILPYFYHPYFSFTKVKGHNGDQWNEWIDKFVQRTKLNQKACIVCLKNTEVEWGVSEKDEIDLQNISHRFQSIFDKMEEERRLI